MRTRRHEAGQPRTESRRDNWAKVTAGRYGALLGFGDGPLASLWGGSARWRQRLFRVYCRLFGYPELAAHRRYALIRKALASREAACVVDIGARNGLYILADALLRPQTSYVAIDISLRHLRRVDLAAKQFGLRVFSLTATAEELSLLSESADLVLTIEVLQFVRDDHRAVGEISRILRPGGTWWCEQELGSSEPIVGHSDDPTLTKRRRGHSVAGLTDLAGEHGLTLEKVLDVEGTIGRWWEGLESRILKRRPGLQIMTFPVLRALAALTANHWTDRSPSTKLYCFVKTA